MPTPKTLLAILFGIVVMAGFVFGLTLMNIDKTPSAAIAEDTPPANQIGVANTFCMEDVVCVYYTHASGVGLVCDFMGESSLSRKCAHAKKVEV